LEHIRRLDDEEHRKRLEIEAIQREKETLLKNVGGVSGASAYKLSQPLHLYESPAAGTKGLMLQQQRDALMYSQLPPPPMIGEQVLFHCNKIDNPNDFRKIGKLSIQDRFLKVKRFKEKKQRRIWTKKIFYDCRKQVADKRLRIKGRFIRKDD
jgi:hypothetical protein